MQKVNLRRPKNPLFMIINRFRNYSAIILVAAFEALKTSSCMLVCLNERKKHVS